MKGVRETEGSRAEGILFFLGCNFIPLFFSSFTYVHTLYLDQSHSHLSFGIPGQWWQLHFNYFKPCIPHLPHRNCCYTCVISSTHHESHFSHGVLLITANRLVDLPLQRLSGTSNPNRREI